jgi:hypothetical protein
MTTMASMLIYGFFSGYATIQLMSFEFIYLLFITQFDKTIDLYGDRSRMML